MKDGFHLVPLKETRGYHPRRNEVKLWSSKRRNQFIRRHIPGAGYRNYGDDMVWFADPMEVQVKLLLREVLEDLRSHPDYLDWNLRQQDGC